MYSDMSITSFIDVIVFVMFFFVFFLLLYFFLLFFFFFFQAEDGIRDVAVTGVQTCALPIFELNFGCPHGMSERGMGSAVGQVPEYIEMVVRWCKANTRMPVITKLTPNITDIRKPARAALSGGTDAVSLINTINSITAVDLDSFA